MRQEIILQLGAGPLMIHSIRLLKQDGFKVVSIDRNPAAPGFKWSDEYAAIDIANEKAIVNYAKEIKADLILPVNEAGVLSAAIASEILRLPGLAPDVALRALDKGLMRDCWCNAGLPQPKYIITEDVNSIPDCITKIDYPAILKPTLNWGSKGVSLVSRREDIPWAIDFATNNCRTKRFIIEQYIPGVEMTVEGLVQNGCVHILAMSDKEPQPHAKYRVAMALNYPAFFEISQLNLAKDIVAKAAISLGIFNGALHCECMINDNGIFLIEMGARGGGGHIFGQIVEAVSGVRMPVALVRLLMGKKTTVDPQRQRGACYKFFNAPQGVFKDIIGLKTARNMAGVLDMGFELKPGTQVDDISSDANRPGFVVTTGETRKNAIEIAHQAISSLKFVMN